MLVSRYTWAVEGRRLATVGCVLVRGPSARKVTVQRRRLGSIRIDANTYQIPYSGCTIGAICEQNHVPGVRFDCRRGSCKSCRVMVRMGEDVEGEPEPTKGASDSEASVETDAMGENELEIEVLACQEEAVEGMWVITLQDSTPSASPEGHASQASQGQAPAAGPAATSQLHPEKKKQRKTRKVKRSMPELKQLRRRLEILITEAELAQAIGDAPGLLEILRKVSALFQDVDADEVREVTAMHGNRANLVSDFLMQLSFSSCKDIQHWAAAHRAAWFDVKKGDGC
ncbi:unnamed protein product [Amoebophrya sp. A120]|nr:unnamed protein product [Amoebophrya sp. A120]|eukprot:GSA120T00002711001.1